MHYNLIKYFTQHKKAQKIAAARIYAFRSESRFVCPVFINLICIVHGHDVVDDDAPCSADMRHHQRRRPTVERAHSNIACIYVVSNFILCLCARNAYYLVERHTHHKRKCNPREDFIFLCTRGLYTLKIDRKWYTRAMSAKIYLRIFYVFLMQYANEELVRRYCNSRRRSLRFLLS